MRNTTGAPFNVVRDTLRVWAVTVMVIGTVVAMWNWRQIQRMASQWANGEDHLVLAATSGSTKDIRAALADGADANAPGTDGFTPLMWAAASGNVDSMELLIDAGADPRAMSPSGVSPLTIASQRGNLAAVRLLLSKGVDPSQHLPNGPTALYAAATFGHEHVIAALLKSGADVNVRCGRGRTALMVASGQTQSTRDGIARLLNAGADPAARDDDGNSAKDEAASAGRDDLLDLIDAYHRPAAN